MTSFTQEAERPSTAIEAAGAPPLVPAALDDEKDLSQSRENVSHLNTSTLRYSLMLF